LTILDEIMAHKGDEVRKRRHRTSEAALLARAGDIAPARPFASALVDKVAVRQNTIIAEVKRGSPSKGVIYPDPANFDPAAIARGYAENGATCISCLTDVDYFFGDDSFIEQIKGEISLPVLRKDFMFDPYQIIESRAIGADAVLLIMAVLAISQAQELEEAAQEMGLSVLVEVHDEAELEAAHELKSPLIGINNRNLKEFVTDIGVSLRLASRVDPERIVISESGIKKPIDIDTLQEQEIFAYLIGGAFMAHKNPGAALGRFLAK